jgi:hypothetical protein
VDYRLSKYLERHRQPTALILLPFFYNITKDFNFKKNTKEIKINKKYSYSICIAYV